jgi:Flp pilus assembly protein TadD
MNLARVLATRGEMAESRFQFEQAIRLKPDLAEARLDYGRLLADRGKSAGAIRQLETAKPDLWRAHLDLAMALEQLQITANGSDAEVRALGCVAAARTIADHSLTAAALVVSSLVQFAAAVPAAPSAVL